jgi:hypothetical protein
MWENAKERNKRCGGNIEPLVCVDRNGGVQPRSEDYGVRGSSARKTLSFGKGIYFIGDEGAPPIYLFVFDL